MPLSSTIEFVTLEELSLDPRNPRLGLGAAEPLATQERVLELMRGWNLEELAVSTAPRVTAIELDEWLRPWSLELLPIAASR